MTTCPVCRAPLEGDQTHCLQCGQRLVPRPRAEPNLRIPAAIVAATIAVAIAAVALALALVESDAERQTADPPVAAPVPDPSGRPVDVEVWPADASAYTVLLLELEDEASAQAQASAAVAAGVPAGVLDARQRPELGHDGWIVFAGRFDTREEAVTEVPRYEALGFPDAQVAFVAASPG